MNSVYCSQGHENPKGSRFCLHCGENLEIANNPNIPITQGIQPGQILSNRYVIVRQLGQGGFGRTYLAEDINRFREPCVLKEFSPQVQTPYVLQKAEELFQREATVLYKLQHPQIPRFRELFRTNLGGKEYLFLVQDYVEGKNYSTLLDHRLAQGLKFTESEARQLLKQILPVLEYIHSLGVIHRDISPDNLILRNVDQLPILIDFGGVKQAAAVASQYYQPGAAANTPQATLLGKMGYAPPEQMQTGLVEPYSDLYSLAATVLVLITGKQPPELIDKNTLTWKWRETVNLSNNLGIILDKMLSPTPNIRYHSAREVLNALSPVTVNNPPQSQSNLTEEPKTEATVAFAPNLANSSPDNPHQSWWTPGKIAVVAFSVVTATGVGVWGVNNLITPSTPDPQPTLTSSPKNDQPTDPLAKYSPAERARKLKLRDRQRQLGINDNFYINLVNQVFWDKNPSLRGQTLSDEPGDESLRTQWDATAAELLDKMAKLSSDARRRLGTYSKSDRDRWKVRVNNLNVSSRALYDLGDAPFFQQFPQQKGKKFTNEPIGQIWHGFVADKLNAMLARTALQKIVFAPGATGKRISGSLNPTGGKVFIAELARNQTMEVNLDANRNILLSIYSPTGKYTFLTDSQKRSWSGKLPESGYYEFAIVSRDSQSRSYDFSLQVENPTPKPTPTPTDTPTNTPTPTPTDTVSPTPTPTSTPTPTVTKSATPTPTPTPTSTPTPTNSPTPTDSPTPTNSPTPTDSPKTPGNSASE
ncbi:MAG: serine/threonine-protein kinase [Calothrix sp. MO_167.B42]|nr:serine/threonine-protein kinase [Calothrix sp. MO_167.B42]